MKLFASLLRELNEVNLVKRLEWVLAYSTGVVYRDDFLVTDQVDLRRKEITLNYVPGVLNTC